MVIKIQIILNFKDENRERNDIYYSLNELDQQSVEDYL